MPARIFPFLRRKFRPNRRRRVTAAMRRHVHERDIVCRYCGYWRKLQVHHIRPFSRGGACDVRNLCLACVSCNARIGTKHIWPWPRPVIWPVYLIRRWWWLVLLAIIIYLLIGG